MSSPIKNEAVAVKQELGVASPRQRAMADVAHDRARLFATLRPAVREQEANIPAVALVPYSQSARSGVKRRREADENVAVADAEVDENGSPHPDPKVGHAKLTTEMDANKFYVCHRERAIKAIKLEPSPTMVGKFNFETFFADGHGYDYKDAKYYMRMVEGGIGKKFRIEWMKKKLASMTVDRGDFLGGVKDCFLKKAVPAAGGGSSNKKVKVEEGA